MDPLPGRRRIRRLTASAAALVAAGLALTPGAGAPPWTAGPAWGQRLNLTISPSDIDIGGDPLVEGIVRQLIAESKARRRAAAGLSRGARADALLASAGARRFAADLFIRALEQGPRAGSPCALAAFKLTDSLDSFDDLLRRAVGDAGDASTAMKHLAAALDRPLPGDGLNLDHELRARFAALPDLLRAAGATAIRTPWPSPTSDVDCGELIDRLVERLDNPVPLELAPEDRARLEDVLTAMRAAENRPAFRPRARALLIEFNDVLDRLSALDDSPFLPPGTGVARRRAAADAFSDLLTRRSRPQARALFDLLGAQVRLDHRFRVLRTRGVETAALEAIAGAWDEALWPEPKNIQAAKAAIALAIKLLDAEIARRALPETADLPPAVLPAWVAVAPAMDAGPAATLDLALRLAESHSLADTPAPVTLLQSRRRAVETLQALIALPDLIDLLFTKRTPVHIDAARRCRDLLKKLQQDPHDQSAQEELRDVASVWPVLAESPSQLTAGDADPPARVASLQDSVAELRAESIRCLAERRSLDVVTNRFSLLRRAAETAALAERLDGLSPSDDPAFRWPGWRVPPQMIERAATAADEAANRAMATLAARRFADARRTLNEFDRLWADVTLIIRVRDILASRAPASTDPLLGLAIPPDRLALLGEHRDRFALLSWIWAEELHDLSKDGRLGPHLRRRAASVADGLLADLPAADQAE